MGSGRGCSLGDGWLVTGCRALARSDVLHRAARPSAVWLHCPIGSNRLLILSPCLQVAAKAQKASVTASEVVRYEEYNARHGARYAQAGTGKDELEDEEPW